ncbi:MAG: hypothetical protein EX272_10655 [Chromatiales bacterium]|nr:MAG: hypothetical protein EX272_10655 [Chromatiales bacterium]
MSKFISRLRDSDAVNSMLRYNVMATAAPGRITRDYAASSDEGKQNIRSRLLSDAIRDARKTTYGAEFGDDIDDWPILSKDRLRANTDDFCTSTLLKIGAGTGGTTGQPIALSRSIASIAVERFFIEQLVLPFGLSLKSSRTAVLRADEIKNPQDTSPPFGVHRFGGRHLILSNPHLNRDTVGWYVDAIQRHGTEILYVYPSMLENLMDLAKANSLSLELPVVLSSSETVAPALFDEVRSTLGATLVDYYGLGERVALASVGPDRQYYFNPLYGRAELIDMKETADDGNALYRIIATGYWNPAMPLIRYDTGDIAIVSRDDESRIEEIQIGERGFVGILGRTSEFIVGPDGSRISGLNHLPRGVNDLVRMQVYQSSPDEVEIRLRPGPGFSEQSLRQLRDNVEAMIPPTIKVDIRDDAKFAKAANGKTPFVIREMTCAE